MPPISNEPYNIAQTILSAINTVFTSYGTALPAYQSIEFGEVSWDCVAGGSYIQTTRGPLPIEDVRLGDEVWGWDDGVADTHRVLKSAPKGDRDLIEIRTGHRTLRVTPDHRLLSLYWNGLPGRTSSWNPEWIAAGEMRRGDVLLTLGTLPERGFDLSLPDGTKLNEDVAWLLGAYTGDGSASRYGFSVCLFGAHRDRALHVIERVWGEEGIEHPRHGLYVYSPKIRDLLRTMEMDQQSPNRAIPSLIWAAPPKIQRAFLDGYRDSDGHIRREGYETYAATSPRLINQVRMLHMRLGDLVSNVSKQDRRGEISIRGRRVKDAKPLYRFTVFPNAAHIQAGITPFAQRSVPPGFLPDRVRSVRPIEPEPVYDLAVERMENFTVDGSIVHNCEKLALAIVESRGGLAETPDDQFLRRFHVRPLAMRFDAWLLRDCQPALGQFGEFPTAAALTANAATLSLDMWTLFTGMRIYTEAGNFFPCGVVIGGAEAVGPEGLIAGTRCSFAVEA